MIPLYDTIPARRFPFVTIAIIVANAAVWLFYQVPDLEGSVYQLGFIPCEVEDTCPNQGLVWPANVFTAMFAHGGWAHILGNLLFLWIFGNNVEDALGRVRFLVFYLLAGIAATALQAAVTLGAGTDTQATIPNIGASGAIAGVLGAYLMLYPFANVVTLVLIVLIRLPAMFFLVSWFLFQLWYGGFSLLEPQADGGVAFFAHIGGFVFGFLAVRPALPRRPAALGPPWQ
jgi:membrane associated rhomboid family serine protease